MGKNTGDEPLPPFDQGRFRGEQPPGDPQDRFRPVAQGDSIDAYGRPVDNPDDNQVIDIEADPAVRNGLQAVRRADRRFDPHRFIEGARAAYGMILEAFWSGDRDTLKQFLADSIEAQFLGALDARERDGVTLDNRLLDIEEAKIVEAAMESTVARITVEFVAELVAVTRDAAGEIIEGNASDSVTSRDRWTFARDSKSADPDWQVVATRPI